MSWCRISYLPGNASSSSGDGLFRACLGISAQNCNGPCWQAHKFSVFDEEYYISLSHQRKYHTFCPEEPVLPGLLIYAVLILFSLLRREGIRHKQELALKL